MPSSPPGLFEITSRGGRRRSSCSRTPRGSAWCPAVAGLAQGRSIVRSCLMTGQGANGGVAAVGCNIGWRFLDDLAATLGPTRCRPWKLPARRQPSRPRLRLLPPPRYVRRRSRQARRTQLDLEGWSRDRARRGPRSAMRASRAASDLPRLLLSIKLWTVWTPPPPRLAPVMSAALFSLGVCQRRDRRRQSYRAGRL
jgi:hypothetical protein